jgi:hypothetical protein
MNSPIEGNPWIWVYIQGEMGNEQYVGQYDEENRVSFIPGFLTKDDALKSFNLMKKESKMPCEVQAVRFKELQKDSKANGFMIFILDGEGRIQEKI